MSLSITINNINDLTDAERAVLRLIVGDKQVTLTGPTATRQFIESIAGCGHPASEDGRLACDECSNAAASAAASSTALRAPIPAEGGYAFHTDSEAGKQFAAGVAAVSRVPASAELDSSGLPWDKRIHATTRSKLEDGTWRKLKGVDKALVATVEAELREVQAIPVPTEVRGVQQTTALPIPPVIEVVGDEAIVAVSSPDPDNRREVGEVVASVPAPPVPPVPTVPTVTPTSLTEMRDKLNAACVTEIPVEQFAAGSSGILTPPAPLTFADLMKHVTPMLISHKLSQDKLLEITAEFGLPHLSALGARPDLVEAVRARIDEVCNG